MPPSARAAASILHGPRWPGVIQLSSAKLHAFPLIVSRDRAAPLAVLEAVSCGWAVSEAAALSSEATSPGGLGRDSVSITR
eukprot:4862894-Pleurochrysis_carterae.AAC.2